MAAVKYWLKVLAVLALCILGFPILVTIPTGMVVLLEFLQKESWFAFFFPGILVFIGLVCVPAAVMHLVAKARGTPSHAFHLPSAAVLGVGAVVSIAAGQLLIRGDDPVLFCAAFILAAALPPLTAVAVASSRLRNATTWRHMWAGLLSGSLLSPHLAILLTVGVSATAYALIMPLRDIWAHVIASGELERLYYSPALIGTMIALAVVAPLVEELVKPLGVIILARRLKGPAEAFLVGMAGGAGFAILENMLYEAAGAEVWGGITAMRAIGGVLHPFNAGLVGLGWYAVRNGRPGAWRKLWGYYGLAVGAHALWNGGLTILFSSVGAYFFGTDTWRVSIYGVGQPAIVVLFLLVEAAVLWRMLALVADSLRHDHEVRLALPFHLDQPRRLAVWAVGVSLIVVSIGVLYGPLLARYSDRFVPLG